MSEAGWIILLLAAWGVTVAWFAVTIATLNRERVELAAQRASNRLLKRYLDECREDLNNCLGKVGGEDDE
jgi:hypothetical protein